MAVADISFVTERDGTLFVGDTRVTVSSLVAAWRNEGYTPEELQLGFPDATLAQVYGAIAYYLAHQHEIDAVFRQDEQRYWQQRTQDRDADPDFYTRLEQRKARLRQGEIDGAHVHDAQA